MFEKVNPCHPDKVADRIAGAIVDLAYERENNPRVAVEVLLGHGYVYIIVESSVQFDYDDVEPIVNRIYGDGAIIRLLSIPQDIHLAANQQQGVRCGDNGIFKGVPPTHEQKLLTAIAASIYDKHPFDGKYLIGRYKPNLEKAIGERGRDQVVPSDEDTRSYAVTICQSNATYDEILKTFHDFFEGNGGGKVSPHVSTLKTKDGLTKYYSALINPLGVWTGGPDTDSGATNRKLGSDMGDGVTGGGLHGKDLSKADVSVNIWCFLQSQATGKEVTATCSIGDEKVCGIPYTEIVETAREYIKQIGGFEKFAEWGLIRPTAPLTPE